MKKIVVFTVFCLFIVFTSCVKDSDWGKVIIPAKEKFTFSEPDDFYIYGDKQILVLVGRDTMVIHNYNQVHKLCYLKTAFPEQDIIIEYVKISKDGKIKLDPRFIYRKVKN
jgi:hypothetical protein